MLRITIDSGQGEVDYTQYVDTDQPPAIQRSINTPSTCTLSLNNLDGTFRLPAQRAYLKIFSTLYNRSIFTGYLVNDPTYNYLSLHPASFPPTDPPSPTPSQRFRYDLNFTSDEYLLQLKSIEFIPAFVNQTQGQILTTIANALCPGFFSTEHVASGQLVPYLQYDPTTSWSEYAKQFGDASNYRYSAVDKELHFQPYGDDDLGIEYDETKGQGSFDPTALVTQSMTTPIVNDITVVGSQEAANNHEDYFMGDGFTGTFPLRHQVFNAGAAQGAGTGNSGSVLLSDAWNETSFNAQVWNVFDPQSSFTLIDNALNIITDLPMTYGESYIASYNGIELAGGIIMQHGEFVFNASSKGIIGGVFDDTTLNPDSCETGYLITPTASVKVTASGASGISIQPFRLGLVPAKGFQIVTEVNHTYVLSSIVSSPSPVRYTQVFTTLGGVVFGGESLSQNTLGNITWQVQDTNIFTGFINTYTFGITGVMFPSFGVYALVNNIQLNLSVTATSIYTPPLATLHINSKIGAGLLAPIYISGNQQYTGAYVTPSGGNLPILPGDLGPEQQWPLGSSLQNQTAEIDLGTTVSSLSFYSNDLPGVGTRIRLQSWESQAAVSRITDPASIAIEAAVVGDDGHRSAIVTNMNPLPRSSEECDAAGQAYVTDRVGNFYQGTYSAAYLFFKQQNSNNIDYYPQCGRYLFCNSPQRGLFNQNLLVSAVTTQLTEFKQEIMTHVISYGPDYNYEKILANFVSQPVNVLLPQDTVIQPLPQSLVQVGSVYLPNVQSSHFDTLAITGPTVSLLLNDPLPEISAFYELRSADLNWGQSNDNYLLGRFFGNQTVVLPRASFEQLWYLRFIYNSPEGTQAISRRSKVLRVYWPQTPSVPAYLYADSSTINCDFNGDIRNIEGIELRDGDGINVYYDGIVGSEFDMMLNLDSLRGSIQAGASVIGGPVGSYMKGSIPIGFATTIATAPPTTVGQLPGNAWTNPQNIGSTDVNQVASCVIPFNISVNSPISESFAGLLCEGFQIDIPSNAQVFRVQATITEGIPVGNPIASTITMDLAIDGNAQGLAQTRIAQRFAVPLQFGTNSQVPDTNPSWDQICTPAMLAAGRVGLIVSCIVNGGGSEGILAAYNLELRVTYQAPPQRDFTVYFFNLMWEYSPGLKISIPEPPQAIATIGYRWGAGLQINVGSTLRTDINYTTLQLASSAASLVAGTGFTGTYNNAGTPGLWYQGMTNGAPASFQVNVPVTGDIYARVQFVDHIGAGAWSDVLYIPQGNLIASDYLGAQGSVPPTITNGNLGSGGLLAYTSQNIDGQVTINLASSIMQIVYPNGHVDTVAALYQTFAATIDNGGAALIDSTEYGFFPSIANPLSQDPTMNFNGPYLKYTGTLLALQQQVADGTVPITNGPFVATTPPPGSGTVGGGGGGTGGGGNCAASERYIDLAKGNKLQLRNLKPGMMVKNLTGTSSRVLQVELFSEVTVRFLTESGLNTRCGYGHVLFANKKWQSVQDIVDSYDDLTSVYVKTKYKENDKIVWISNRNVIAEICRIHLQGIEDDEHVYMVDGIWAHNLILKNGS